MKVYIFRHEKVLFAWDRRCTSSRYDELCSAYDEAPIAEIRRPFPDEKPELVYVSSLPRSGQTARKIFGEVPLCPTPLLDEVPLRSSFDTAKKLPLWFWNVSARLQWAYNGKRQEESRRRSFERAREFVKMLLERQETCAVVSHGFFMHILLSEMKRSGFRIRKTKLYYRNGEYTVAER